MTDSRKDLTLPVHDFQLTAEESAAVRDLMPETLRVAMTEKPDIVRARTSAFRKALTVAQAELAYKRAQREILDEDRKTMELINDIEALQGHRTGVEQLRKVVADRDTQVRDLQQKLHDAESKVQRAIAKNAMAVSS